MQFRKSFCYFSSHFLFPGFLLSFVKEAEGFRTFGVNGNLFLFEEADKFFCKAGVFLRLMVGIRD